MLHRSVKRLTVGDAFIGYQSDTAAAIVMQVCQQLERFTQDEDYSNKVDYLLKLF